MKKLKIENYAYIQFEMRPKEYEALAVEKEKVKDLSSDNYREILESLNLPNDVAAKGASKNDTLLICYLYKENNKAAFLGLVIETSDIKPEYIDKGMLDVEKFVKQLYIFMEEFHEINSPFNEALI